MIVKRLINLGFCISLCFVSINAFADSPENSGEMQIKFNNMTGSNCQLTNQSLYHGVFTASPPQTIPLGGSASFNMQQSAMGPDVALTYQCGSNFISFEVEQSYSLIFGHEPSVKVLANQGLLLDTNNQSSSVMNSTAGVANISIRNE